jgi:hypothetical protein
MPILLLLLLLLLTACGGDLPQGEWTIDTLETGRVVTTNPAEPTPVEGAPVALEHLFRIGTAAGPDETNFGAIAGVVADARGQIHIADRQANQLRTFSAEGEYIRTVGGPGDGPGEFSSLNGLRITSDTLVLVDQEGGRYTLMDPDGELLGTARRELGYFSWLFDGNVVGDRVREIGIVFSDGESRAALLDVSLDGSGATDTLQIPSSHHPTTPAFSVRSEVGGMNIAVPHAPRPIRHVAPDGTLWLGHGADLHLFRTLEGDTLREIRGSVERAPVSREEIDEWRAGSSVERFLEMGGDLDMDRIPAEKPAADRIYHDPDDYLWVAFPGGERETRLAVFDPDGRFVALHPLPGVVMPFAVPIFVRDDRLYLVARDDFDVEGVEVFRISRPE